MNSALLPLAWLYGGVMALRNAAFDLGLFASTDVGIPVISVGNISAGGTGKTPLVEHLARTLEQQGYRVGILSRGYGRETTGFRWVRNGTQVDTDASRCGDEPVQIAQNISGAYVAVDEERVSGAQTMIAEAGIEVLLLDDAFQHRWIARTIDIVVMTASDVIEGDQLLPAGRLREPLSALGRARALIVTGCADDDIADRVREQLRSQADLDVFLTYPSITELREFATGKRADLKGLAGKRMLAMSGIGNPRSFRETLGRSGLRVAAEQVFADHHVLTAGEVSDLRLVCRQEACEAIVMTQKDAMRMRSHPVMKALADVPVYYAPMAMEWIGGAGAFERIITAAVAGKET